MSESTSNFRWHRIIGGFASLFLPGAGQLALGHSRRAAALLGGSYACLILGAASGQLLVMDIAIVMVVLLRIFGVVDSARLPPARAVPRAGSIAIQWLLLAGLVSVLSLGLQTWVVTAFRMPSGSMIPALQVGDHFYARRLGRVAQRGEVIVFTYPVDPEKVFIKRVIAVGGDTVQICGGQVLLNGEPLRRVVEPGQCEYTDFDEERPNGWRKIPCVAYREWNGKQSYVTVHNPGQSEWWSPTCGSPATVPPDHLFVMGDNRDNSHDSRFWGMLPQELVKGTAWFLWWSRGENGVRWNRLNRLVHPPAPPPPATLPKSPDSPPPPPSPRGPR